MVLFADTPAIEHDLVAGLPVPDGRRLRHGAGEIDTGDQRKAADDGRLAGDGEAVLVVHRGMRDVDGDIAFHQVGFGQTVRTGPAGRVGLGDLNGAEGHVVSFSARVLQRNVTGLACGWPDDFVIPHHFAAAHEGAMRPARNLMPS